MFPSAYFPTKYFPGTYFPRFVPPPAPSARPDIRRALRDRLINYASVSEFVGTRVRPKRLSESDSLPAITYLVGRSDFAVTLDGISDIGTAEVPLEIVARTMAEAVTIRHAVWDAVHCWTGQAAGLWIYRAKIIDEDDEVERIQEGSDECIYRITLMVSARYRLTDPIH